MTIDFLGYGGAFEAHLGNSAAIVTIGNERLLIDAGYTVYPALRQGGQADTITGILISHTHDDHVGSLGAIVMHHRYVTGLDRKMPVYLPQTLLPRVVALLQLTIGHPEKYVDWQPIESLPMVRAIDTTGFHVPGLPSYGYVFREDGKRMIYSGDLADARFLKHYCRQEGWMPDLVFHDCTFAEQNHHHAYYRDLQHQLADWTVVGYHCDPSRKPADCLFPLVGEGEAITFRL